MTADSDNPAIGNGADAALIERLLRQDQAAYFALVKTYQSTLLQVARGIVGSSIADEVVQDAWLAAFKALPKFERRASLKTWLIKIVSNCAKTRLRRENRSISFSEIGFENDTSLDPSYFKENGHWGRPIGLWNIDSPDAILASEQLKACIDRAILDLPVAQRTLLTLRDIQGLEMQDICKILEVSESNARVLLHRARSQVRESIDRCQRK